VKLRIATTAALIVAAWALSGCATIPGTASPPDGISVAIASPVDAPAMVRFTTNQPVVALHFADDLGGYRRRE
jgi:hypothetical protein